MKVLECSSNGDIRFSAFGAKVEVFGKLDTIENHYQLSKRFISNTGEVMVPKTWKDAKGKKVDYFIVGNKEYEPKYLSAFYNLLWVKYLDNNLELVEYAKGFDDFSDMFKGKAVNCQADIIKKYIKEGRKSIMKDKLVNKFIKLATEPNKLEVKDGDLLESDVNIIVHQANCMGVMGAGIALSIKSKYPQVFAKYKRVTGSYKDRNQLLGRCLLISEDGRIVKANDKKENSDTKIIANLFGQYGYGRGLQTDYEALEKALIELKYFAQNNNLSVGLPYNIGCGNAGGDWSIVEEIIEKIFVDYPVEVYKL